jgi:hypothetical protein
MGGVRFEADGMLIDGTIQYPVAGSRTIVGPWDTWR